MTDTSIPAAGRHNDLRLDITSVGGMPLNLAGFLLRALGTAYPNTRIATNTDRFGPTMSLLLSRGDLYAAAEVTDAELAELAPGPDDEATVAFTHGFADGKLAASPPPWLATLLYTTAHNLADSLPDNAENYLEITINPSAGEPGTESFTWAISRPGRPSPHQLRRAAEQRTADLERKIRHLLSELDGEVKAVEAAGASSLAYKRARGWLAALLPPQDQPVTAA